MAWKALFVNLWDDVFFNGTATGTRDAAYGEMMFSMLCGVTEEDWFQLTSRGNAVGGGLMSRLNIIGMEGNYENVSNMHPPQTSKAMDDRFLPRVMQLEDADTSTYRQKENLLRRLSANGTDALPVWVRTYKRPRMAERSVACVWSRHEDRISAKIVSDAVEFWSISDCIALFTTALPLGATQPMPLSRHASCGR